MQLAKAESLCAFFFLFPTVPNAANPAAPETPEDNAIPESSPSPPDQGRIGPEVPGNPGEQIGRPMLFPRKPQLQTLLCFPVSGVQIF